MSDERVAIFVDGSNLYHGLTSEFPGRRVDYRKLITKLVGSRRLLRTYYYNAPLDRAEDPGGASKQQKFFDALRSIPYLELKLGRLEKRPGGTHAEKGVDIMMSVDMVSLASRDVYDTAVVVTGDGDFAYAVYAVKGHGKHVENVCTRSGRSRALSDARDLCVVIDENYVRDILQD